MWLSGVNSIVEYKRRIKRKADWCNRISRHIQRGLPLERIILKKQKRESTSTWYSSRARAIIQRYFTSRSHSPQEEKWWFGADSSQAKFILTDFIHWIDVYMSRSSKDKPTEEVSVPYSGKVTTQRTDKTLAGRSPTICNVSVRDIKSL